MKVRGITVLARKMLVTRQFGHDAWAAFYRDLARAHDCFRPFVTPNSLIPLSAFLAFHDELMQRFYGSNEASYFELGSQVGRFALNDGPFSAFKQSRDLAGLVAALPTLHQTYFVDATTRTEASLLDDGVEFKVLKAPERHPYFAQLIVGYIRGVLELYCANPIQVVRLSAGSGGDYSYLLCPSTATGAGQQRSSGAPQARADQGEVTLQQSSAARRLSDRELDVLLLIARGQTNKEIGATLGISSKTAQHHVARAYRKIGVSSRVDAALWLTVRGIAGK